MEAVPVRDVPRADVIEAARPTSSVRTTRTGRPGSLNREFGMLDGTPCQRPCQHWRENPRTPEPGIDTTSSGPTGKFVIGRGRLLRALLGGFPVGVALSSGNDYWTDRRRGDAGPGAAWQRERRARRVVRGVRNSKGPRADATPTYPYRSRRSVTPTHCPANTAANRRAHCRDGSARVRRIGSIESADHVGGCR